MSTGRYLSLKYSQPLWRKKKVILSHPAGSNKGFVGPIRANQGLFMVYLDPQLSGQASGGRSSEIYWKEELSREDHDLAAVST